MTDPVGCTIGPAGKRSVTSPLASAVLVTGCAVAQAMPVYPGCDVPKPRERWRPFYIDPINRALGNDGSKEKPWRTLAEVVNPGNRLNATRGYVAAGEGPHLIQPIILTVRSDPATHWFS